jgi:hypothetical protein
MEVRCGKCNKLFRVSDDKITGKGIKFPCTRRGEYVRITREDFEQYTLSRGTLPVDDLLEPKPAAVPLSLDAAEAIAEETVPPERESQTFGVAAQTTYEEASEEQAPQFAEPDQSAPEPALKPEPAVEIMPEPLMSVKPKAEPLVEPQQEPLVEPQQEPLVEPQPEPLVEPQPEPLIEPQQEPESQPEPKPEPLFVPRQKAKFMPDSENQSETARPISPVSAPPTPTVQPVVTKKEYVRPAALTASPAAKRKVTEPSYSSTASHSGKTIFVLIGALIILGLAGYGVFIYLHPSQPSAQQKVKEAAHEMISMEGLHVGNTVGTVDTNGDLLVTGVIENTTEKTRASWYVVLDVYDAQGAVLTKIGLLNGNQIYNRRDYDIMEKRGANVQELKTKLLQEKGVVIPPMGRVNFEVRYLQPPPGIASFVAQTVPFDPIQLYKEIAEDMK